MVASKTMKPLKAKQWRPRALRAQTLAFTTFATALLLVIVIYLHYFDTRYGAIIRGQYGSDLHIQGLFQVRYLPTIIVVLYGTGISIIDLDIKRLEPWFGLSTKAVYHKSSPLMCKYDTDFVLSVMLRALTHRQVPHCVEYLLTSLMHEQDIG